MSDQDSYLTTGQLAERWKISENTIRNWRHRGTGPRYFKPSGRRGKTLYRLSDIIEWERRNTVGDQL